MEHNVKKYAANPDLRNLGESYKEKKEQVR